MPTCPFDSIPRKRIYLRRESPQLRSCQTCGKHAAAIDGGMIKAPFQADRQSSRSFRSTIAGPNRHIRNYLDEFAVWKLEESDEFLIREETITTNKRRGTVKKVTGH